MGTARDLESTVALVDRLRKAGGEPSSVEVKSAAGGLPKSVAETLCAFANTNGGTIILGLDENTGFTPVQLSSPSKLRDDLCSLASSALHPPLRITADVVHFEGHDLVVAEVSPIPSDFRPCYVDAKGISNGSYVRVGDGDRRMTRQRSDLLSPIAANLAMTWNPSAKLASMT